MFRRRLAWQIYGSFLALLALSLLATEWHASSSLRESHDQWVFDDLQARADLLVSEFAALSLDADNTSRAAVDARCKLLGLARLTRVTVIALDGAVLGDSDSDPQTMENHRDRSEIVEAMSGQPGRAQRPSPTLGKMMYYVAAPVRRDGRIAAVVRVSRAQAAVEGEVLVLRGRIIAGGLVVALVAAAAAWWISLRISRPLVLMRKAAECFARGDLGCKLPASGAEELSALSAAMNDMARQLDERIRAITHQRNEIEAVLASMMEAVIAVDSQERILRMNRAAGALFGVDTRAAEGRILQEAIRSPELQKLVTRALESQTLVEGDVAIEGPPLRFLQAHGSRLSDVEGLALGAVIVLNDVTRLRRLETVRRDFVANVSHELRTPITSIKGFLETLRGGAVEPETAKRFLDIAVKHAERLNAIIEDLLALSRLEQDNAKQEIALDRAKLREAVDSAVLVCQGQAAAKGIVVEVDCPPDVELCINRPLIEQALVNLIDNAIKFSEPAKTVRVEVSVAQAFVPADEKQHGRQEGLPHQEVVLAVRDQGWGIPEDHLARVFERFYRVDKARSRKAGGTGLGLAIVKHIAQAHGGRVSVESTVGKGSVFRIHLPAS